MSILQEGFQQLRVPPSWQVIKLDEHRYYRQVCGKYNLKSMDYLLLDPEWGLYLVEIKDYDDINLTREKKEELAVTLNQKAEDTKLLVRSVAHMHMRKAYYRWLWRVSYLRGLLPTRSRVWLQAAEMIKEGRYTILYDVRHRGGSID